MQIGLIGQRYHKIDTRGRVMLPPDFKNYLLKKFDKNDFILIEGFNKGSLILLPADLYETMAYEISKNEKPFDTEVSMAKDIFFGKSEKITIDNQGRILIPTPFRKYANIKNEVVITGRGNSIGIWSKKDWEDLSNSSQRATLFKSISEKYNI